MAQALLLKYNSLDFSLVDDNCDTDFSKLSNIKEEVVKFKVDIIPNPSTGIFRINSNLSDYECAVYQNGRLIKE